MFVNIKDRLADSAVRKILSCCLWDKSPEGVDEALRRYPDEQFYGWVENDEPLGVCGFRALPNAVEVCHIAVAERARGRGVGGAMVAALREAYGAVIAAETHDGAVDFYRKCGFAATLFYKYNEALKLKYRRWMCVLPSPKPFDALTDGERDALYPIILSEYDPAWPAWFTEEKAELTRLIGAENIARISHYGSTSVPGLPAKPTVDIMLEIPETADVDALIAALPAPDYICLTGEALTMPTPPPHLMIIKGYTPAGFSEKLYHIHVQYLGDPEQFYFRDYLIAHPETAAEYAALKRELSRDFKYDRDDYTDAKGAFVREVTARARGDPNESADLLGRGGAAK